MPTVSVEDYLKSIYLLEQRTGTRVKTKAIADKLEISLPSVTSMLKSLADDGLVEYQKYKGVTLSESGRLVALKVVRKHRLIELFLVHTLEYTWDEVHQEAERLEHAISDELASRIEQFLSFPLFDPHGDPIPTADGQVAESGAVPISQAALGHPVRMTRVLDQSPELLRHLDRVGLVPGSVARVLEILSFDGQVIVSIEGRDSVTLSREVASRILVEADGE